MIERSSCKWSSACCRFQRDSRLERNSAPALHQHDDVEGAVEALQHTVEVLGIALHLDDGDDIGEQRQASDQRQDRNDPQSVVRRRDRSNARLRLARHLGQFGAHLGKSGAGKAIADAPFQLRQRGDDFVRVERAVNLAGFRSDTRAAGQTGYAPAAKCVNAALGRERRRSAQRRRGPPSARRSPVNTQVSMPLRRRSSL
ncbi:MAG: hypothetical protein ACK4MF_06905 [Hyphomicrobiaceae bacterium]